MLNIELIKLEQTGWHCANPKCEKLPKYTINILGNVYYIKIDTTVALVSIDMGRYIEYHCGGCINSLYQMIKSKLDPKLWAFH